MPMADRLTHIDKDGNAVMVDVYDKEPTERVATACGSVLLQPETVRPIRAGGVKKGDVLSVAQLAGTMGAKRTPALIQPCTPLALPPVHVDLACRSDRKAVT